MKKRYLCLILLLSSAVLIAQSSHFNKVVSNARGDLNNDNLADEIIVLQDTIFPTFPYQIRVFFAKSDGEKEIMLSSDKAIEPQFPDGKEQGNPGIGFAEVAIDSGVVSIKYEFIRGHCEFQFRYQQGNFDLIGFSYVNSDGRGRLSYIDYNLTTGIKVERAENYETDEVISSTAKKVKISPLPHLQDIDGKNNYLFWAD